MSQNLLKINDGRTSFWQWDTGQKFVILDESVTEVHLSHKGVKSSRELEIKTEDNMRICDIPDVFLQIPKNLIAYAVHSTEESEHTITSVEFAVKIRSMPDGYISVHDDEYEDIDARLDALENGGTCGGGVTKTQVEQWISDHNTSADAHNDIRESVKELKKDQINKTDIVNDLDTNVSDRPLAASQGVVLKGMVDSKLDASELPNAINEALSAAKESGEFDGEQGIQGEKGDKGETGATGAAGKDGYDGEDGLTPFINSDGNWHIGEHDTGVKAVGIDGKDGAPGNDGKDGVDGFSPVVSVESIDGGHRVFITDKVKTNTFDVKDGKDATADISRQINIHNAATDAHNDIRETISQKSQVQIITWEVDD